MERTRGAIEHRGMRSGLRAAEAQALREELGLRGAGDTRPLRRSYLYDAPAPSPYRMRRRVEIAMIAMAALLAVLAGWAVVHILSACAEAIGGGIAPRVARNTLNAVMMTLPIA